MKKDLNYYLELLRMDVKAFNQLPDTTWEVSYKKLPGIVGKGFGTSEASRDLQEKAQDWITKALAEGIDVLGKPPKGTRVLNPVKPKPCPFCGGTNITVDVAGCEGYVGCSDCDYDFSVGEVDFEKRTPVENQAKKLWNDMRPIEIALQTQVAELKARIAELEGATNGK